MNNITSLFAIFPIIIVCITGMVVLLLDSCVPMWRSRKELSAALCLIGICVAGFYSIQLMGVGKSISAFNGAIVIDSFGEACCLILLVTAALAILIAMTYLENKKLNLGEYYALVLFATAGGMLMTLSNDLIVLFIAIETLSVALYVLAGFARTQERSEEAALKYFLLGAFAAGFLLYGIALIYGGTANAVKGGGTTNLLAISHALHVGYIDANPMLMIGIALVLVGLAFKAGLVPFHMWTPDVYEGAPTSVTAFMAASVKIAAFAAILRFFNAFIPISQYWLTAIQVLAILSMFGGNILAVTQNNVKRMLAYSSIAHAGYLMVAVSAMTSSAAHDNAFSAITFYLLAYAIMTMGSFGVLIWLSRRGREVQTLQDLKGLGKTDPTAAYVMLVFMLSLGGIPPTMGFLGKWFIFASALQAGQMWLAITLAFASMISIFYYLKVVWMMCFQDPDEGVLPQRAVSSGGVLISVILTTVASLLFGLAPNLISALTNAAATVSHP